MWEFDEKKIPAKVEAMFQAVMEMLEEGAEIPSLTVSQITARAGIGKGTAYEYFESKEELIRKAVFYDNMKRYQKLEHSILGQDTFRRKIMAIMDWVQGNYDMQKIFEQMAKSKMAPECMPGEMQKRICGSWTQNSDGDLIDHIIETGIRESQICRKNRFLSRTVIIAQLMQYVMYTKTGREDTGITEEEMKEHVYCSIKKLLQTP